MSAITTLLTAVAIASGFAAAPVEAGPYRQDRFVEAVVNDRIIDLFHHATPATRSERTNYLAGFTLWYDSNCDFLPMPTFEAIRRLVKDANQTHDSRAAGAVEAGYQDARAFLGEKGCSSRDATAARGALGRFWDGIARPRDRQGSQGGIERAHDDGRF
ncbi:hypothetical protein [Phreatobacter stygius]|uniref:Uncharacterized protein n=1 Tax=Phreatobacter stygius TaxID=1940610 RepID=A0A4D7AW36_9HYPH|nr:hypothetical protein [Phreatobacter stygius]QCI64101.1 hypothetical protein E8M01_07490 [Phreatobacter stygius]